MSMPTDLAYTYLMTTTQNTTATYRVLGTTDEVTECEHCGRVDLKGTIILGIIDIDGSVEDRTYFGAVCGARAAGKPVKELRKEAASADFARGAEARRARFLAREAEDAAFLDWCETTYGTRVRVVSATNKSIHQLRAEFAARA
jgi:hypothetical protein